MPRTRNYRNEYEARIARAQARGLTRSQARGHARPGEAPVRSRKPATEVEKRRLELALKLLRHTGKQRFSAKFVDLPVERFRHFLKDQGLARYEHRRWVLTDHRPREMQIFSRGRLSRIVVADFDQASSLGQYLNAVRSFLGTNDISKLEPFVGWKITDAKGKQHPLETNPNALYRLAHAGGEGFEHIYRLIS